MKTIFKIKYIIGLTLLLLFSACSGVNLNDVDLSNVSEDDINKFIVCDAPYKRHGTGCCLDQDSNNICDSDEQTTAPAAPDGTAVPPTGKLHNEFEHTPPGKGMNVEVWVFNDETRIEYHSKRKSEFLRSELKGEEEIIKFVSDKFGLSTEEVDEIIHFNIMNEDSWFVDEDYFINEFEDAFIEEFEKEFEREFGEDFNEEHHEKEFMTDVFIKTDGVDLSEEIIEVAEEIEELLDEVEEDVFMRYIIERDGDIIDFDTESKGPVNGELGALWTKIQALVEDEISTPDGDDDVRVEIEFKRKPEHGAPHDDGIHHDEKHDDKNELFFEIYVRGGDEDDIKVEVHHEDFTEDQYFSTTDVEEAKEELARIYGLKYEDVVHSSEIIYEDISEDLDIEVEIEMYLDGGIVEVRINGEEDEFEVEADDSEEVKEFIAEKYDITYDDVLFNIVEYEFVDEYLFKDDDESDEKDDDDLEEDDFDDDDSEDEDKDEEDDN